MGTDPELARTLVTSSTDRYESASRWALLACLTIFVFHVMTFSPFIRAQVQRAAAADEVAVLSSAIKELKASLDAQQAAIGRIRSELDAMLEAKKREFAALQRAVQMARTGRSRGAAIGTGDPQDADPTVQRPLMVQMPLRAQGASAGGRDFGRLLEQENVVAAVRAASSDSALRDALRPLVEQHIIRPHFDVIEAVWRQQLPELRAQGARTKFQVEAVARQFPGDPAWRGLPAEVDRYLAALGEVKFQPPDDPAWWHSVIGKADAVIQLREEAARQISPASFEAAAAALDGLLKARAELMTKLDARLTELRRQFDAQQERLGELIAPIKGVALDLSVLVGNFPLFLGILLGVAVAWPARRYRELSRATWLARQANLVDTTAEGVLRHRDGNRHGLALTVALVVLLVGWVLVAAWQLSAWAAREGPSLVLLTVMGAAVVIASAAYRAQSLRGAAPDLSPSDD